MKIIQKHISCNIAGLLSNYRRRSLSGLIEHEGRMLDDKEARQHLAECQAKGWKLIPCGDCEGFDHFGGGCPGHEVKEGD